MMIARNCRWLAWAMLLGTAPLASAGIIADDFPTVEEIADPTYRYTFQMLIDDDCIVRAGDFFTFYDIFLPTDTISPPGHPPTQPANWILSTPAIGSTPSGLPMLPTDDPGINNLTWTYFGPDLSGPQSLGVFTAVVFQEAFILADRIVSFSSQCTGNTPAMPPTLITMQRIVLVPEPMSLATVAIGLGIGLPIALRRRRPA